MSSRATGGMSMRRRMATAFMLMAGSGLLQAGHATALSAEQAGGLFNANGCNGCHAVDEQRIGPRFRDVANRYRSSQPASLPRLVEKIRHGGAGAWGTVPMVSNPRIAQADAQALAAWILALPPMP